MISKEANQGYTLIEIMIALAVFAILSVITASSMYQSFDIRSRLNIESNQLNEILVAITRIKHDTEQIIDRSIISNDLLMFPPFTGLSQSLEFSHGGIVNPNNIEARSTLQRVAYICDKSKLIRRTWGGLDIPIRNKGLDKIILTNLSECKFSYISHSKQILAEWREYAVQQNQKRESLPLAIRFNFKFKNLGSMSLDFAIPGALYAA